MGQPTYDVVGVGNAIVDVFADTGDETLERLGLDKGVMTLVDETRAAELYGALTPALEMSGGSAANTIAGIASLGGRGAYIGKVRDDTGGAVFRDDLLAAGIEYRTPPAVAGAPTARCIVFVTPDAQRTMQTHLGISVDLRPDDIDAELVRTSGITYLEGYLFDRDQAKRAFVRAAEIAHAAGRAVSLSLSDPFCVRRHRASFRHLVEHHVEVLFANEEEIMVLYETDTFEEAVEAVRGQCEVAALTRSERGSLIVAGSETYDVEAVRVERVVDTTGAGDLYAAGFLFGLADDRSLPECGRLGSIAAAEIITHHGARPEVPLDRLVAETLHSARDPYPLLRQAQ